MNIIDRETARSLGLKMFYTGKVCRNGHLSERYVSTGNCKECLQKGPNLPIKTQNSYENPTIVELQNTISRAQAQLNEVMNRQQQEDKQAEAQRRAAEMADLEARRVAARAEADRRAAIHEAFGHMITKRFRLYEEDVATFRAAALGFAAMRCPALRLEDMQPPKTAQGVNRAAGTAMFTFMIYADDYDALLAYSNQLLSARSCFNPERARQQAIARAEREAAAQDNGEPPMNFK